MSQSSELASALEAAGVAHDLVVLPATQHGFDAVFGSLANQIAQAEVSRFIAEHVTNG